MAASRYTLTFPGLSHGRAFEVVELVEGQFLLDPLAVTINETDETLDTWETVAWFASAAEAQQAATLVDLQPQFISQVEDRDWVRDSLIGLGPVSAGRFHLHGSHDKGQQHSGTILEIDAATAFGTGHHGTTWGCLMALDEIVKSQRPRHILDVGTGTGVLGLAAAKFLKRHVLATDIDAVAVGVAMQNARRNGVLPWFRAYAVPGLQSRLIENGAPFDLIFANILARPLAQLAPGLARILTRGGKLVLSGLTVDQLRWIKACYINQGLSVARVIHSENWVTLIMAR